MVFIRLTGVNSTKVIEVIEIKSLAGSGTYDNPYYEVTEYYSFDGKLLARRSTDNDLPTGENK